MDEALTAYARLGRRSLVWHIATDCYRSGGTLTRPTVHRMTVCGREIHDGDELWEREVGEPVGLCQKCERAAAKGDE